MDQRHRREESDKLERRTAAQGLSLCRSRDCSSDRSSEKLQFARCALLVHRRFTRLRRDPADAAGQVEWVAKHSLMQRFRDRAGVGWDDPSLVDEGASDPTADAEDDD